MSLPLSPLSVPDCSSVCSVVKGLDLLWVEGGVGVSVVDLSLSDEGSLESPWLFGQPGAPHVP